MDYRAAPLRVFVYGTLLRGESNHHFMSGARLLGRLRSAPRYSLYSLGAYPVLCCHGSSRVSGEVYRISPDILNRLDGLEGYPDDYDRMLLRTPWGPAWVYYHHQLPAAGRFIAAGSWRDYRRPG